MQRPAPGTRVRWWSVPAAVAAFVVIGNLSILGLSIAAYRAAPDALPQPGIRNFRRVDGRLWRGAAPTAAALADLAAAGVRSVVDLRAEEAIVHPPPPGVAHHTVPIRDGQPPGPDQVRGFMDVVDAAAGVTFVHCAAGVGRTGSMVAAYRVLRLGVRPADALADMLAVGPPSLEQIAFVLALGRGALRRPGLLITAASRLLDMPRRARSRIRAARRSRR